MTDDRVTALAEDLALRTGVSWPLATHLAKQWQAFADDWPWVPWERIQLLAFECAVVGVSPTAFRAIRDPWRTR